VAKLDQGTLRYVEAEAVAARMSNPDNYTSETIDDYTYRYGSETRQVVIRDDWWSLLSPSARFVLHDPGVVAAGPSVSVESALAAGRRAAEARMLSRATVRRKTGATTTDADGFEVPAWSSPYTSIPCRIAGMARSQSPSRSLNVGGAEVQVSPCESPTFRTGTVLRDGDLIEITAGELAGSCGMWSRPMPPTSRPRAVCP
jgi:hypothetical protein